MELTRGTTIIAVGLILALGGCASYEKEVQPWLDQYALAGCSRSAFKMDDTERLRCAQINAQTQQIFDKHHSYGGGGGTSQSFIWIMNPNLNK